jgi:hypothetical protein
MFLLRSAVRIVARIVRAVGREIAGTIRWGAEPNAIAQSINPHGPQSIPPSIGGAMAAGAGRRIGEGSVDVSRDDIGDASSD